MDDLTYKRQKKCAESADGHTFAEGRDGKMCVNCHLVILYEEH